MKFNNLAFSFLFLLVSCDIFLPVFAQVDNLNLRAPSDPEEVELNIPTKVKLESLPDFPASLKGTNKILESGNIIPIDARLRLSIDSFINAKTANIGDYFKAHVLEDFYIPTNPPKLVLPKGTWLRGRISSLKRPNIFRRSGKINIHLYQVVTPLSEVATVNAELDIQKGIINAQGLLDPISNYDVTRTLGPSESIPGFNSGVTIRVTSFGIPFVNELLSGSLAALFLQEEDNVLSRGQELQIVLRKDLQFDVEQ